MNLTNKLAGTCQISETPQPQVGSTGKSACATPGYKGTLTPARTTLLGSASATRTREARAGVRVSPLSGACRLRGPMSHGFRRGLHYAAPSRGWVKHGGRPQVFEPLRLPQGTETNACAAPTSWKPTSRIQSQMHIAPPLVIQKKLMMSMTCASR